MAKGFIRGMLWGAGVSFGAVTLISVAGDGPNMREAREPSSVRTSQLDQDTSQTKGSAGNRVALTGAEPAPDTLASIGTGAFDSAQVPETGFASALPKTEVPDFSSKEGLAATDTTAPSVTATASRSLATPDTEPAASVSTEPAQPPAPEASQPRTAFDKTEVRQVPEVAANVQEPAPALEVASIATDPIQPVVPAVPATATAFAEEPQKQMEQTASEDVAQVAVKAIPDTTPDTPDVMSQAPDVSAPDQESQSTATVLSSTGDIETPDKDRVADAPKPQVTTDIVLAMAQPAETKMPQIMPESNSPDVVLAGDLVSPAASDPVQAAGESASARVSVKADMDTLVTVPQLQPEPVVVPVAAKRQELRTAMAPESIEASDPDLVASADTTLSVPPLTPSEEAPVAAPRTVAQVKINRLPTLGGTPEPVEEVEVQSGAEIPVAPQVAAVVEGRLPIERYGQAFENSGGKPLMAVVLMDTGVDLSQSAIGLPALRQLPYPVSFAVDSSLPDAAERMRAYRQEGFEVLAMVDLPDGANATDAEVNLSVALERLPEVVGVLEGVNTGVQTTRDSGRQVAQILAQTGHGFITQNQGLNTVQKLAAREGVPSAVVFRDFDAEDQSARVISRFLDQAAFRAGQEGVVIMLGRMREETIAALLVWALQDRASQVALAPVSGALLSTTE